MTPCGGEGRAGPESQAAAASRPTSPGRPRGSADPGMLLVEAGPQLLQERRLAPHPPPPTPLDCSGRWEATSPGRRPHLQTPPSAHSLSQQGPRLLSQGRVDEVSQEGQGSDSDTLDPSGKTRGHVPALWVPPIQPNCPAACPAVTVPKSKHCQQRHPRDAALGVRESHLDPTVPPLSPGNWGMGLMAPGLQLRGRDCPPPQVRSTSPAAPGQLPPGPTPPLHLHQGAGEATACQALGQEPSAGLLMPPGETRGQMRHARPPVGQGAAHTADPPRAVPRGSLGHQRRPSAGPGRAISEPDVVLWA